MSDDPADRGADCPIPAEYLAVLRDLGADPRNRAKIGDVVGALGDQTITDTVFPMPAQWRSDDYALFRADARVCEAEYRRRLAVAIDEWIDTGGWSWRSGGLAPADLNRIGAWVRAQLDDEINNWEINNWEINSGRSSRL
jgi:hypothetical protein